MAEVDRAFTSSAGLSTRNEGWARSAASFCHSLERPAETRSTKRSRRSRKYCASPLILGRRTDAAGGTENSDVHNPTRAKDIVERGRDRSGPSADRGWAQVPMNSNKFTSCSRKRQEGFKSANDPSDVAILSMAVDSQSLFRRSVPRLLPRRENEPSNDVLQALLSEANRELASLLRDVRTESHGTSPGDTRSQPASRLLMRAVRCAAKQYMLQAELGNLALTDELTGLYNRRGFMAVAERQLKLGRRSGRGMLLFVMDVDRMKHINDSFGHSEGDRALKRTADALEETFRDSDVVARLGGDEFAVLAIEASGHSEAALKTRLFECLRAIGAEQPGYEISLSFGVARFDLSNSTSIGELMVKADQAMYERKRRRSKQFLQTETNVQSEQAL